MADRPKPAVIGAFVLTGLAGVVAAVAIWGSGKVFEEKERFVCYFPGAVGGLDVGAPVKFRGVPIGAVVDLRLRFAGARDQPRIPVVIELYGKRMFGKGPRRRHRIQETIELLIPRGLNARLESQSLVTGQRYVSLDLYPDHRRATVPDHHQPVEIPTLPTTLDEAGRLLSAIKKELERADLQGMAHSLGGVMAGLDRMLNAPDLKQTMAELPGLVTAMRRAANNVSTTVTTTGTNLGSTLTELRQGLRGVRSLATPQGSLVADMQQTFHDLQKAALSVSELAEYLQRNPNALLAGRKRRR
jgi:paraquat-inducible protein B